MFFFSFSLIIDSIYFFLGQLGIVRKFLFEKNQFYVIILKSALEKQRQYKIKMRFKAKLTDDLAGLYKSTYKRKDGTEM